LPAVAHDLLNRPSADASAVTPQVSHKSPLVERSLCSIPWQGDFPRGSVPTVIDALRSVRWKLDDRPISMELHEFAAIDGPEETSATEMHQRIGPVFGRVQEAIAIAHELPPTVPWDVSWWTKIVEAGDPLDPIDWDAPLYANWPARQDRPVEPRFGATLRGLAFRVISAPVARSVGQCCLKLSGRPC
jgi:hypothetical protein